MRHVWVVFFAATLLLPGASACDDNNTSSVKANYATVRAGKFVLTGAQGEPVAELSAVNTGGRPVIVISDPAGKKVGELVVR